MKRLTALLTLCAFLMTGAVFHSCQKDEINLQAPIEHSFLKDASTYGLPIYWGQNNYVGDATITMDYTLLLIYVSVDIDETNPVLEGFIVEEAHMYAGLTAPQKHSPGQFPYYLYQPGFDFTFDPIEAENSTDPWYFAVQVEFINPVTLEDGSAWIIPELNGNTWNNPSGKAKGWGQYFLWYF